MCSSDLAKLTALVQELQMGLRVQQVQLKNVHPPTPVQRSFDEVNRAQQERQLDAQLQAAERQMAQERARRQSQIDSVVGEYNALGCVNELPPARYEYCVRMHAQYSSRIDEMKASGNAALADMRERELARARPLDDIIRRQTARIDDIAKAMTGNFNQHTKAQERLQSVQSRISEIGRAHV